MKKKIALLLIVTMLAEVGYSPTLVQASDERSGQEQTTYEQDMDSYSSSDLTEEKEKADEDKNASISEEKGYLDESATEADESVAETNESSVEDLANEEESISVEDYDSAVENAADSGSDVITGVYNGLNYEIKDKKVTITGVVYDEHYDSSGKNVIKKDRCMQTDGNVPSTIEGYPVVTIEEGAYSDCINLTSLKIPDSVNWIGMGAFSGCTSLTSITLPDNEMTICAGVFENCTALTSIHIPASVKAHGYIGESPAYHGVFAGCSALRKVTFGEGIKKIPRGFFLNCSGLLSIDIPDTVTEIEPRAFTNCKNLTDVHLSEALEIIGNSAFNGCSSLTKIYLPSTLTTVKGNAFSGTNIEEINIPKNMKTEEYTAANRSWPGPFNGVTSLKKVTFDEGTTSVPRGLFYSPSAVLKLEEVIFPDSVTEICYSAFYNCSNIGEISLPKNLEYIDAEAFMGCSKLKFAQKELPQSLKEMNSSAFEGCVGLDAVVLPKSLTYIGGRAFKGCTGLTEINIPASMKTNYSEWGPFAECSNIKTVTFEEGITEIQARLFQRCYGLESIELPDSITKIDYYAFVRCTSLSKIKIPDGVTGIEDSAFEDCTSLKEIKLPDSLKYMGSLAFGSCTALEKVTFPNESKIENGISEDCFSGCTALVNATVPAKITYLPEGIFADLSKKFAIYGYTGSYAENYAKQNSLTFVSIGKIVKTSFKITFNKNATKAVLDSKSKTKTVKKGKTYGTLPTPTYSGYYFLGWYTTAKSGGKKITSKTKVNLTKNQTLYARWAKADLTKAEVKVSNRTWNGKAQTPKVTVKFKGITLTEGKHYTLSTTDKEPGTAKVTVKGKGEFVKSKSVKKSFKIYKATRKITVSDLIKSKANKGKTFSINAKVNGNTKTDNPKITLKSSNSSVVQTKGTKVTLLKTGYSYVTVNAGETKHYKAVSKKILVTLQGTQKITVNPQGLKKESKTNTYSATNDLSAKSLGVKTLDAAAVSCTISSTPTTADAWVDKPDRLTLRGKGTIKIKITAKESAHHVYPKATMTLTVEKKGFALDTGKTWGYSQNSDDTVTLTKYYGKSSEVTIPAAIKINGTAKTVSALGNGVFKNKKTITKVSIPNTVLKIGDSAFEGCEGAKEIEISVGSKLKRIGENAFRGCVKLKSLHLPETVTSIGKAAFMDCSALSMLKLPNGLKKIEDNTMKNCKTMGADLYLPAKLETIGEGAFENCIAISNVYTFGNLKQINKNAFYGCISLTDVIYAGTKKSWQNSISWTEGNGPLQTANLTAYAYGTKELSSQTTMSDEEFLSDHADYLKNSELMPIAKKLQSESATSMTSLSEWDDYSAALISQLEAGTPDLRTIIEHYTNVNYTEDQLNKEMALELLQNMADNDGNASEQLDLSNYSETIKTVYGYFKENESLRSTFIKEENQRKAVAKELAGISMCGKARDYKEIYDVLTFFNDAWDQIEYAYKGVGTAIDAYDFLMSYLTVLQLEYGQILELKQMMPEDSGLYKGLEQLEEWCSGDLKSVAIDYATDEVLKETAKLYSEVLTEKVVDAIFQGKGLSASGYIAVASSGFKLLAAVCEANGLPSVSAYNKAWVAICNTRYLRTAMENQQSKLIGGENNSVNRRHYTLVSKAYFASLNQQVTYVAAATDKKDSYELLFLYGHYKDGLNYTSYINSLIAKYQGL